MSVVMMLESMLIGPLKLVFEIIYALANRFLQNPGLSIIVLSLVMNFLVLPLYRRADAMQEESRDIEARLHDGVAHIKKTFSGDERMMILQEYYRQNNYKPTDALNGSVSLLLEVPFFMAAYQFLSNLQILKGASLGPIADLGAPDGLLVLGGITLNLLPILMTLVNVISSAIYLKGFPLKTKIQLYAMAGFFLVFLYASPSGLVFYWTLNNVFSLVKTIFYKLKNPRKVVAILASAVGVVALVYGLAIATGVSLKLKVILAAIGVCFQLPMVLYFAGAKIQARLHYKEARPNRMVFLSGAVFLTVLVGMLIPSTFIAASPQEFLDVFNYYNPLWYIVRTTCLAAGTFLIWMNVFYWLANPKGKAMFDGIIWILCGMMLVNYMFFGTDMGVITSYLYYEDGFYFSMTSKLINLAVVLALTAVMYWVFSKWRKQIVAVLLVATVAIASMSAINISGIYTSVEEAKNANQRLSSSKCFSLTKNGQNVVVLVLDRGMGAYIPYLINEKPELMEQFSGFTYYPNTISFGAFTNWGMPAVYGGYEYTPVEMNKRDTEAMVDKHNEALKMMPVLFAENEFEVTVCDPPYANYQWTPDLSIFNDYPDIYAYNTEGSMSLDENQEEGKKRAIENRNRNFFCFSIMKTMPLIIQPTLYNSGWYNQADYKVNLHEAVTQMCTSTSVSEGMSELFLRPYYVLDELEALTAITDAEKNTALIICNNTTHDPMLLQEPDYVPNVKVDNTQYDLENAERFTVNGRMLLVEDTSQMSHYHANMAALLRIGEWLDYLKENDVYDNTRIILVSDHGAKLGQLEELLMVDASGNIEDGESFYPLLMVKDFDSKEFTISDVFMTNADVPTLATQGIIENAVNPFTGKWISDSEKYAHEQFISLNRNNNVKENLGTTYLPAKWASVKNNIWDPESWTFYKEEQVLKEHHITE